jgi:WD40 repeat protein
MKTWRASIFGILGIAALVAAAAWLPNYPACTRWLPANLEPGASGGPERPFAVRRVEWSGDGRTLLTLSRGEFDAVGYLTLYDTTQNNRRMPFDVMGDSVCCAAWFPDGLHLAVGTPSRRLLWIDLKTRDQIVLAELPPPQNFTVVAAAADGRHVAAATSAGQIYLCDAVEQTSMTLTSPLQSSISDVCFSRDAARLVCAQRCGTVSVWEAVTGTLVREFPGEGVVTNAEFLADEKQIISAGLDDKVRIRELARGEQIWCRESGSYGVSALAVTPDGRTAAWGGFGHTIAVWDLESLRKKYEIATPAAVVLYLQFSPDGSSLAAAGMEATIRRYDVRTGVEFESAAIDVSQGIESRGGGSR